MKKSCLLLVFFMALLNQTSKAAETIRFSSFTKEWKKAGRLEFMQGKISASVLDSLDVLYEKSPHAYLFYARGEELFVVVSCTFDLYEIKGDTLVKKYQYFNRGYNCGARVFPRDGLHYLLGGHGFWMNQMDLLSFDEIHGSWEWVKVADQPMDYYSNYVYQNSKGIFSLFGGYYNPRTGVDGLESQGYFFDWTSKLWQKVEVRIDEVDIVDFVAKGGAFFVETQDYVFLSTTSGKPNLGWNIIDKESGFIYYFQSRNTDMALSPFIEIIGNQLFYQAPNGDPKTLDVHALKAKSKQVGQVRVLGNAASPNQTSHLLLYLVLVLGLGGGLIWLLISWRKKKLVGDSFEEELPGTKFAPIDLLLPFSGQLLTTETLDQLLGIDRQANFDSKRMKRARLINEINEQYLALAGKELIERDKKPEDRRYVYYKIQA